MTEGIEKPVDLQKAYVAESVVLAYRGLRNDKELEALAKRAVDTSFLKTDFRGFSHPINDFAWLWLRSVP